MCSDSIREKIFLPNFCDPVYSQKEGGAKYIQARATGSFLGFLACSPGTQFRFKLIGRVLAPTLAIDDLASIVINDRRSAIGCCCFGPDAVPHRVCGATGHPRCSVIRRVWWRGGDARARAAHDLKPRTL